ncbi:opioid growth factor receptor-like [Mugil cephalus]|uniref:opioid growth factor receptor-like n=1 Tax=Mugil cephalus TaxID=48193 RepID=UPI001FB5B494|nr:opioid growth factor receptor-like [Mugil cephalus]
MRPMSAIHRLVMTCAWLFREVAGPFAYWAWFKILYLTSKLLGYVARLKAIVWRQDGENEVIEERDGNQSPPRESAEDVAVVTDSECHLEAGAPCEEVVDPQTPQLYTEDPPAEAEDEFDAEEYRVEAADELYCDYDSTWETKEDTEDQVTPRRSSGPGPPRPFKFSRFENAARDMQNYRHGYPFKSWRQPRRNKASDDRPNLNFYLGLTASVPDGVKITDFHEQWFGEYDTLEYVHTFIQWLFPLQEPGMNYEASILTKEEIRDFIANPTAMQNLLKSYKLMLDFYGIELCDEATGEVRRASNWKERFNNLNSHTHNNLRITRILKCLGTLGYRQYQAPLVHFFLHETLVEGQLPNVKESVLNYFVFAVLDKRERRNLIKFAYENYYPRDEFVWCPKKIQMLWSHGDNSQEYLSVDGKAADVTGRDFSDTDESL